MTINDMQYENYFKQGSFYTRNDIWKVFHPNSGEKPSGGNWDTGYTSEGHYLIVFMNIDTAGRTGHDFANEYNEEDETITWFGKPNTNSGQPTFQKLIGGELKPIFFARWDSSNPNFKFLGTARIIDYVDNVLLEDGRTTIKLTLQSKSLNEAIGDAPINYEQETVTFALEKHLEEFIIENWSRTEIGAGYDILSDGDDLVGQQYQTDTGRIDILAIKKDASEYLVIELKKGRPSDSVVGQIARYIGYIEAEVADENQEVKGAIIALDNDLRLRRALQVMPSVKFYRYEIQFRLTGE